MNGDRRIVAFPAIGFTDVFEEAQGRVGRDFNRVSPCLGIFAST
jgi:hypothetical protein